MNTISKRSRFPATLPQLRDWQMSRLRRYLRDVVLPFSKHYRALFRSHGLRAEHLRTFNELSRVPFTTKQDLLQTQSAPDPVRDFVIAPDPEVLRRRPSTLWRALTRGPAAARDALDREFRPVLLTSTTGRSTEPVPFLYTAHDIANLQLAGSRMFAIAGATREMRFVNLFPFAPHLAFWQMHYGAMEFGAFALSTGGGKMMGTDGNLRVIKRIRPDVLVGMPTFIYHVLNEAIKKGLELPCVRKLVLGGEKVPMGMRRKLRELCAQLGAERVDVVRTYGFTEAKIAWVEAPFDEDAGSSGYYVHPDLALIEIVDPATGRQAGEGEPGEIVFTALDARGSAVLRYRTGDLIDGGLVCEECPYTGVRIPRLAGEITRRSNIREMQLDKLKGTIVDFNALEHVLDDAPHVGTWQLELRKRNDDPLEVDELVLHISKSDNADEESLREELNRQFAAQTEVHLNRIHFHSGEELRRLQGVGVQLKEQRVVDNRPKATDPADRKSTDGTVAP